MSFARASIVRGAFRAVKPQLLRQTARRSYASGGHSQKASSDLPWAIAGGLITIPTVWYVLSSSNHHPHEPKDAHIDAHTNEIIEEIGEKAGQAQIKEQEVQEEHEEEEKTDVEDAPKDDSASDSEVPSPRTSMVGNNIVNSVPDAKGGSKKRIDSTNALKLGEVATDEPVDGAPADQAAASKTAGDISNSQSGKQEGISNSDTKHSVDPSYMSKKGEGSPETSKSKGTVDPKRPQTEGEEDEEK